MIAPVFDEIPASEQAFSPNLLFFQHPLDSLAIYRERVRKAGPQGLAYGWVAVHPSSCQD